MKWLHSLVIDIDGEPDRITAQEKGETVKVAFVNGKKQYRIHHYEKAEVAAAKTKLAWQLKPYKPKEPITGAVAVHISWYFGTDKKKDYYQPKLTKPDVDNMAKGLLDVMTHMNFWADDNQVCELTLMKFWAPREEAGIELEIYYDRYDEEGKDE